MDGDQDDHPDPNHDLGPRFDAVMWGVGRRRPFPLRPYPSTTYAWFFGFFGLALPFLGIPGLIVATKARRGGNPWGWPATIFCLAMMVASVPLWWLSLAERSEVGFPG